MNRAPRAIVTMIHGTFDVSSRWADANSKLCKAISNGLGGDVLITKFRWSGKNSQNDRQLAAKQLTDHIAAQTVYFPKTPHFLIAHSHGGNILQWALETMQASSVKNIAALVTVSTPFIELRPRPFAEGIQLLFLVWRAAATFTLALGWLAFFGVHYDIIANLFTPLLAVTGILGVMLLTVLPLLILYKFLKDVTEILCSSLISSLEARQRRLLAYRSRGFKSEKPLLCIYTRTDEVNRLFFSGRKLLELSQLVESLTLLSKPTKREIKELSEILSPFKGLITVFGSLALLIILMGNMGSYNASGSLLFDYGAPLVGFGLVLSVALPVAVAIGTKLYGTDASLDALVVHFDATMHPASLDIVEVAKVAPMIASTDGVSRNVHTGILYGDEVASRVVNFLTKNLPVVDDPLDNN